MMQVQWEKGNNQIHGGDFIRSNLGNLTFLGTRSTLFYDNVSYLQLAPEIIHAF